MVHSVSAPTELGRRTREKIIVAAADLFRSNGVRSTSIEDVLTRSGCGRSQLYHYFSGKADLVAAVLEYQLDRFLADQMPIMIELDTWPGIRRWLDAQSAAFSSSPDVIAACPIGALAAELAGTDEGLRQVLLLVGALEIGLISGNYQTGKALAVVESAFVIGRGAIAALSWYHWWKGPR